MRAHLDFIRPLNHLPLLSEYYKPWFALSHQVLRLLLSSSSLSAFPSSPCFSRLPRHGPWDVSSLFSAAPSSKRNTSPLVRGTYRHLETLWETRSFLVRPHTILQETCHLTKGTSRRIQGKPSRLQQKKQAPRPKKPTTSKWFALLSQNWPTSPYSEGLPHEVTQQKQGEACLPAGRPSYIFAVKTQDEPNWRRLFLSCKPNVRGKRWMLHKTWVSPLLLLQKGSRQSVDICPPPRYKRSHADPKTGRNSLAGWPLCDTTRKVL